MMRIATSVFAIFVIPVIMMISDGRFMLLKLNSEEQKPSKALNESDSAAGFVFKAPDDKDMLGWSDSKETLYGGIQIKDWN